MAGLLSFNSKHLVDLSKYFLRVFSIQFVMDAPISVQVDCRVLRFGIVVFNYLCRVSVSSRVAVQTSIDPRFRVSTWFASRSTAVGIASILEITAKRWR